MIGLNCCKYRLHLHVESLSSYNQSLCIGNWNWSHMKSCCISLCSCYTALVWIFLMSYFAWTDALWLVWFCIEVYVYGALETKLVMFHVRVCFLSWYLNALNKLVVYESLLFGLISSSFESLHIFTFYDLVISVFSEYMYIHVVAYFTWSLIELNVHICLHLSWIHHLVGFDLVLTCLCSFKKMYIDMHDLVACTVICCACHNLFVQDELKIRKDEQPK